MGKTTEKSVKNSAFSSEQTSDTPMPSSTKCICLSVLQGAKLYYSSAAREKTTDLLVKNQTLPVKPI